MYLDTIHTESEPPPRNTESGFDFVFMEPDNYEPGVELTSVSNALVSVRSGPERSEYTWNGPASAPKCPRAFRLVPRVFSNRPGMASRVFHPHSSPETSSRVTLSPAGTHSRTPIPFLCATINSRAKPGAERRLCVKFTSARGQTR